MTSFRSGDSIAAATRTLDFTDGDTFKRFTIQDGNVSPTSAIVPSIRRADVEDVDDEGWTYTVNVVKVSNATFDISVAALMMGEPASGAEFPNETVTLAYVIQ